MMLSSPPLRHYRVLVGGRPIAAHAPTPHGAARLVARALYGNGMSVKADPEEPGVYRLTHPHPRPWRPVVSGLLVIAVDQTKEGSPP